MCIVVPGSFGSPIPRDKRYRISPGTCARVSRADALRSQRVAVGPRDIPRARARAQRSRLRHIPGQPNR